MAAAAVAVAAASTRAAARIAADCHTAAARRPPLTSAGMSPSTTFGHIAWVEQLCIVIHNPKLGVSESIPQGFQRVSQKLMCTICLTGDATRFHHFIKPHMYLTTPLGDAYKQACANRV